MIPICPFRHNVRIGKLGSFLRFRRTEFNDVRANDYVVEASVVLCQLPEAEGETVHLTDALQYDVLTIYTEMVKQMTNKNTFGRLPLGVVKALLEQKPIRETMQVPPQFIDYLDYAAELDTKDCQALLSKSELENHDLMQALPQLIHYYKENSQI